MVSSPKGLGPEKDCAGKSQQHIQHNFDFDFDKEQSVQSDMKGSGPVIKWSSQDSSKRKQPSEAAQSRGSGSDSRGVSQDRRLKRTAVIREERWTSGVASSRRKIYQLEVLEVPNDIIVICVITVDSAVQINRIRLSSVYFNYLWRIPGQAASWRSRRNAPSTLYNICCNCK
jgi:hypothetical protein